jgi:hypothetical protein
MQVEQGQLRQWKDGSGHPFMIVTVDRTKTVWNVTFLKADGRLSEYHEDVIRRTSKVISSAPVQTA